MVDNGLTMQPYVLWQTNKLFGRYDIARKSLSKECHSKEFFYKEFFYKEFFSKECRSKEFFKIPCFTFQSLFYRIELDYEVPYIYVWSIIFLSISLSSFSISYHIKEKSNFERQKVLFWYLGKSCFIIFKNAFMSSYSLLFQFRSRGRMKKLSTRFEVSAFNLWVRNVKTSEVGQKCQSRLYCENPIRLFRKLIKL